MRGVYGAKKKTSKPPPEPFQKLELGWTGRGELPTVTTYELLDSRFELLGKSLYCGMYINELLVRLVNRSEPNMPLFALYESTLRDLTGTNVEIEQVLRRFEKYLLEICGYGLLLDCEADSGVAIDPAASYFYQFEHGPVREQSANKELDISGITLLKFANDEPLDKAGLRQTKRLMRQALSHYLGDKPLLSRSLFEQTSN